MFMKSSRRPKYDFPKGQREINRTATATISGWDDFLCSRVALIDSGCL